MTEPVTPSLASAKAAFRKSLDLILPPKRETVDEYAAKHRLIPRPIGGGFMLWDPLLTPYTVAPQRCLKGYDYLTVAIAGPGQSAKTTAAENALLEAVEVQPRDILWYMPTGELIDAYVKDRIDPMIRAHEEMNSRLGTRPIDDTLKYKRFAGMRVQFLPANYNNLISKNSPLIVADEIDAYDQSLGDIKVLLDVRRQRFGRASKLLVTSHPDLATGLDPGKHWRAGVMRIYADSDRRVWYWPCPHCGAWSSPAPIAKRVMTLEWPKDGTLDEIQREAHLLCPVNGCVIEDKHRRQMNVEAFRAPFGGWIGRGQEIDEGGNVTGDLKKSDTAGFWYQGVMSPFLLNGIGGLARELVKAEREFEISGDATTVKEVTVKQLGIPYTLKGSLGTVEAETLAERSLNEAAPLGVVPDGVRFLTAWFDVQAATFEGLVRGFGPGGESWVIDKFREYGDTATDHAKWIELLTKLINRRYPLGTDPSRGMAIRAIGWDSQGAPGTADRSDAAWIALRTAGLIRSYGKLDGRDLWSLTPTRGAPSPLAPRLSVMYPDSQRKDRKVARTGIVPLAQFNVNAWKDDLQGHLLQALPGNVGFVHFPKELRSKEPPHVVFEQLTAERRDASGKWIKPAGVRNEMMDMMVGCHVLARLHGLNRIRDWDNPPWGWAAPWDKNTMIGPMMADTVTPKSAAPPRKITDVF